MRVLVAGATGALGAPTLRELVARGHEVFGLTRSQQKAAIVEAQGATAVSGDVLEVSSIAATVERVKPEGVLQLLNALPKRGPLRASELRGTNELRTEGTANLLAGAIAHGARRYVVESMIFGYASARSSAFLDEEAPFGDPLGSPDLDPALEALGTMERLVREATTRGEIEGVILRLGVFYGPAVGSTLFMTSLLGKRLMFIPGGGKGAISWIHVEDAASACADALERAPVGAVYNVVDDEPAGYGEVAATLAEVLGVRGPHSLPLGLARRLNGYAAGMATTTLRASNERIKSELGWKPRYPTIREGALTIRFAGRGPRR